MRSPLTLALLSFVLFCFSCEKVENPDPCIDVDQSRVFRNTTHLIHPCGDADYRFWEVYGNAYFHKSGYPDKYPLGQKIKKVEDNFVQVVYESKGQVEIKQTTIVENNASSNFKVVKVDVCESRIRRISVGRMPYLKGEEGTVRVFIGNQTAKERYEIKEHYQIGDFTFTFDEAPTTSQKFNIHFVLAKDGKTVGATYKSAKFESTDQQSPIKSKGINIEFDIVCGNEE